MLFSLEIAASWKHNPEQTQFLDIFWMCAVTVSISMTIGRVVVFESLFPNQRHAKKAYMPDVILFNLTSKQILFLAKVFSRYQYKSYRSASSYSLSWYERIFAVVLFLMRFNSEILVRLSFLLSFRSCHSHNNALSMLQRRILMLYQCVVVS